MLLPQIIINPKKYDHKTIIERMLSVDEEQRPDISELFYLFQQYKTS